MYEMLGNQLFMVRNYPKAAAAFESALVESPENKAIRRRLIICYTQTGKVDKAFDLFLALCQTDTPFIMQTDPLEDDCPCPELGYMLEANISENRNSADYHRLLGMIWLYCDAVKSMHYFQLARELAPEDPRIHAVISILEPYSRKPSHPNNDPGNSVENTPHNA